MSLPFFSCFPYGSFYHFLYPAFHFLPPHPLPFLFCFLYCRSLLCLFPCLDFRSHFPVAAGFEHERLIPENAPHVPGEHFPESHAIIGIKAAQRDRRNDRHCYVTAKCQPYLFIQKKYNGASTSGTAISIVCTLLFSERISLTRFSSFFSSRFAFAMDAISA